MATQNRRISRQQIALIHVAAHQLGMGDADYRALLVRAAGVRSASGLDAAGFEAVMRRFEALGFAKGQARRAGVPAYRIADVLTDHWAIPASSPRRSIATPCTRRLTPWTPREWYSHATGRSRSRTRWASRRSP